MHDRTAPSLQGRFQPDHACWRPRALPCRITTPCTYQYHHMSRAEGGRGLSQVGRGSAIWGSRAGPWRPGTWGGGLRHEREAPARRVSARALCLRCTGAALAGAGSSVAADPEARAGRTSSEKPFHQRTVRELVVASLHLSRGGQTKPPHARSFSPPAEADQNVRLPKEPDAMFGRGLWQGVPRAKPSATLETRTHPIEKTVPPDKYCAPPAFPLSDWPPRSLRPRQQISSRHCDPAMRNTASRSCRDRWRRTVYSPRRRSTRCVRLSPFCCAFRGRPVPKDGDSRRAFCVWGLAFPGPSPKLIASVYQSSPPRSLRSFFSSASLCMALLSSDTPSW